MPGGTLFVPYKKTSTHPYQEIIDRIEAICRPNIKSTLLLILFTTAAWAVIHDEFQKLETKSTNEEFIALLGIYTMLGILTTQFFNRFTYDQNHRVNTQDLIHAFKDLSKTHQNEFLHIIHCNTLGELKAVQDKLFNQTPLSPIGHSLGITEKTRLEIILTGMTTQKATPIREVILGLNLLIFLIALFIDKDKMASSAENKALELQTHSSMIDNDVDILTSLMEIPSNVFAGIFNTIGEFSSLMHFHQTPILILNSIILLLNAPFIVSEDTIVSYDQRINQDKFLVLLAKSDLLKIQELPDLLQCTTFQELKDCIQTITPSYSAHVIQ